MSEQETPATDTTSDPLASARAKLKAMREAREARELAATAETPESIAEAIAAEELASLDDAAIAEATAKHGKLGVGIALLRTRLGVVIVKRAHVAAFQKFQDLEAPKMADIEQLVRPCVVYPTAEEFDKRCRDLPAVLGLCGKLIGRLAGGASKEQAGKS